MTSSKIIRGYTVHCTSSIGCPANPDCNCVHLYWEGCVICSIYLRQLMKRSVYPLLSAKLVCSIILWTLCPFYLGTGLGWAATLTFPFLLLLFTWPTWPRLGVGVYRRIKWLPCHLNNQEFRYSKAFQLCRYQKKQKASYNCYRGEMSLTLPPRQQWYNKYWTKRYILLKFAYFNYSIIFNIHATCPTCLMLIFFFYLSFIKANH